MKKSETEFGIEPESVNWKLPYMLKCHEYKNKFVFVVHNYECAYMASINNSVVYITDDKEKYNKFVDNVVNSIQFGNDDYALLIKSNQWLDLYDIINDFLKEENMSKFDVAIMNPPYDGNLHLKILEKVIPIADKVVNISPVSQLVNCVNTFKAGKNDTKKYFAGIGKHLIECGKIFSIEEVLNIFVDARISNPLAIQTYEYAHNSIEECERVNSHNGMKAIVKKVYDYSHDVDNIENHLESNKKDGYRIKFGRIGGGTWTAFRPHTLDAFKEVVYDGLLADGRPHWQMCSVNQYTKKTEELPESLPFATKVEAQNFIDSYNTKFLKTCLGFLHVDMHIHPEYLPYMQDYTQPWDDKRFCEYFGITGYISDTEAEPGSEWETILNTMKEYK